MLHTLYRYNTGMVGSQGTQIATFTSSLDPALDQGYYLLSTDGVLTHDHLRLIHQGFKTREFKTQGFKILGYTMGIAKLKLFSLLFHINTLLQGFQALLRSGSKEHLLFHNIIALEHKWKTAGCLTVLSEPP